MSTTLLDVQAVRRRFSSLQGDFVFLDAPGGSQVPDEVGDAIARTLREASANIGANYETSKRDERVRVVSCVASSNAVGTIVDLPRVAELAHEVDALVWVDAVQYAAHAPVDVQALGCDVFIASAYKFCGPHLGVAYGRHELLESWRPYKARPAANSPVGRRFEPGTAPYELFAGFSATIAYLESIGGMATLSAYERDLGRRFLDGLPESVIVYGLQTMEGRVATFLLNVDGVPATEVATAL